MPNIIGTAPNQVPTNADLGSMAYQDSNAVKVKNITFNDGSSQQTAATGFGFKNRIINGAMMIDQRNAGASVTLTTSSYTLDRWFDVTSVSSKFSVQQSSTAPSGFVNSALLTSLSAYTVGASEAFTISQRIEGYNVADLGWGTASASPVTVSFWVRSSLTGTFGGSVRNSAVDRSYPFSYTISAANTWEQKSITIAGDTTGTWLTTNGVGINLTFGIGVGSSISGTAGAWAAGSYASATGATSVVGTNGATFYITGVQLEKGSTATSFDYRPYGTELALCQRYYYKAVTSGKYSGYATTSTIYDNSINFPVSMRIAPSALEQSGTAGDYTIQYLASAASCTSVPTFRSANTETATVRFTISGGGPTAGQGLLAYCAANGYLAWSAEL